MENSKALEVARQLDRLGDDYPEFRQTLDQTSWLIFKRYIHSTAPSASPIAEATTDKPKFADIVNGHAPKIGKSHRFGSIEDVLPSPSVNGTASTKTLPGLVAPEKEWFSSDEFAVLVQRSIYSVGDWCRTGRLNATRGKGYRNPGSPRWSISRSELARYRKEGLLDACSCRNNP